MDTVNLEKKDEDDIPNKKSKNTCIILSGLFLSIVIIYKML